MTGQGSRFWSKPLEAIGVPDLSKSGNSEKCVWLLAVFTLVSLLLAGVVATMVQYFDYPIATTVSLTAVGALKFPDVYVCPGYLIDKEKLDPYSEAKLQNYTVSDVQSIPKENDVDNGDSSMVEPTIISSIEDIFAFPPPPTENPLDTGSSESSVEPFTLALKRTKRQIDDGKMSHATLLSQFTSIWQQAQGTIPSEEDGADKGGMLISGFPPSNCSDSSTWNYTQCEKRYRNESYREFMLRIGYETHELFQECAFQAKAFNCSDQAEAVVDTSMGKCFLIKSFELQTAAGSGLSFVLKDMANGDGVSAGPWIRIEDPFDPFGNENILLSEPGYVARIRMTKTIVTLKHAPQSKFPQTCVVGEGSKLEVFDLNYTRSACRADCFQNEVIRECKCLLPVDPKFLRPYAEAYPFCQRKQLNGCVLPLMGKYQEAAQASRKENDEATDTTEDKKDTGTKEYFSCLQGCAQSCRFVELKTSVSYGKIRGHATGAIIVDVAFNSLQVHEMQQSFTITACNLVSNLGGQLGIYLGASIITFIQFLFISIHACFRKD